MSEQRRKGFGSLEELVAFLRAELAGGTDEPSESPGLASRHRT
jgi:hypothetical protein